MEKDLVVSGTNENEATPLLPPRVNVQVLVKKEDEILGVKKAELSDLSSELSGLKLEPSTQATTKPVDEPVVNQQETAESPTLESGDTSADAVEDMSVDQILEEIDQVLGENNQVTDDTTPAPPVNSPLEEEVLTESPEESESGNRRCQWLDCNARFLILEVILLAFPISMIYYGIAYFQLCPGGDKLPTLILILGLFSLATLTCRIVVNISRVFKTSYDGDKVPPTVIVAGEFLVVVFYLAEFTYIFTMDVDLCDGDFYEYVFNMNNLAALFILALIFVHIRKLSRCIRILRE